MSPFGEEGIVAGGDLTVIEDAVSEFGTQDVLEVTKHQLSVRKDLIKIKSVLGWRGLVRHLNFSVKRDDWPKCSFFGKYPKLPLWYE